MNAPRPAPAPSDLPAESSAAPVPAAPRRTARLILRVVLGVFVVAMVAMWAGIFLGFFDKTAPGTLDDATFAQQAEPICAATKAQLESYPKANTAADNLERADVVARTNTDLRAMLARLQTLAPTEGRDGGMAQEWLADWSTYVGNREDYVTRLRTDPGARFLESPKSSPTEQVSKPIDRFAYVNEMDSCDTPKDMA